MNPDLDNMPEDGDVEPAPADERHLDKPDEHPGKDPLRGSRTSGAWVGVTTSVVLLVLLVIFVVQNTRQVHVRFLGWTISTPLAAALLIAVAVGMALVALVGSLRIIQLRRRVRREKKALRKR